MGASAAKAHHLEKFKWKPGQSGNPRGSQPGQRRKLSEDFIADIHESWLSLGRAAITTVAWTDPSTYLKVVASLMPRDIEVTVTNINLERMTSHELEERLRQLQRASADTQDPLEAEQGADQVFRVD